MKTLCLVVLLGLGAPALAQQAASSEIAAPQVASTPLDPELEEIIVSGRKPANLFRAIERVEEAVYDRFNSLNSNDEFDIHCFMQAPTGSNIPLRTCAPNFVTRTESRAAETMVKDGRGGNGNNNNPARQRVYIAEKSKELTEEMQRLAREDQQLLKYLMRLDELKTLQANDKGGAQTASSPN